MPSQIEQDRRSRHNEDYPYPARADTAPTNSSNDGPYVANNTRYSSGDDTTHTYANKSDISNNGPPQSTNGIDFAEGESPAADGEKHAGIRKRLTGKSDKSSGSDRADSKDRKPKRFAKWNKSKLTPYGEFKAVVLESWINLLLILVPVGFAINYAHLNGIANFVINFVAIVPLAAMLGFATEELAKYTNETLGGLLNATFGNATELIVSIIALKQKKVLIVQTSLIGSMLSNLLLVLGMCFFFGGITRVRQHFNITVAQTASSMLALSIGSLIIPTAFVRFGTQVLDGDSNPGNNNQANSDAAPISRGTSVILLLVYASYLLFQLKTHREMYNQKSRKGEKRKTSKKQKGDTLLGMARMGAQTAANLGGTVMNDEGVVPKRRKEDEDDDEEDAPVLSLFGALITLTAATVLIAFCSEFMVTGINTVSKYISQEFIGLILLPIVGNAAEHATAVTVACKDKMDLAIGVAVGSSMQIALLVLPLMVVIGWCGLGQPEQMTLAFDGFQVTVLFIAVLLVNYLIQVSVFVEL